MNGCRIALANAAVAAAIFISGPVGAAVSRVQDPPSAQAVFRANADAVAVDVSVRRSGRVLTGLQTVDFEVLDNGVPQQVVDVSYGKIPIDVTVALDVSYSVTGRMLDQLRRAMGELMRDLAKADRLKLIMFNMRVTRVVDFTTDVAAVERAIQQASPGGGTTLMDAISVALVAASDPDRRQLLAVFTDGADSISTTEPEVLLDIARRSRATITMLLPGPPTGLTGAPLQTANMFGRLAGETGGWVMSTSSLDLGGVFRNVLDEFRSTYVLHFIPQGVERKGFHTLTVNVKRPSVTVRARRGYFGG